MSTIFCVALLAASQALANENASATVDAAVQGPYCGVYSLHRASLLLAKPISMRQLVKAEYIGSRRGSSTDELVQAAKDCGLNATALSHMTWFMLSNTQQPVILHVKSDFASKVCDHWVLFGGTNEGKAWIYETNRPPTLEDSCDLCARWDGTGIIVSDEPIEWPRFVMLAALPMLYWGAVAAGVACILSLRPLLLCCRADWHQGRRAAAIEAAAIVFVGLPIALALSPVTSVGLLSSRAAILAIQENHYARSC